MVSLSPFDKLRVTGKGAGDKKLVMVSLSPFDKLRVTGKGAGDKKLVMVKLVALRQAQGDNDVMVSLSNHEYPEGPARPSTSSG